MRHHNSSAYLHNVVELIHASLQWVEVVRLLTSLGSAPTDELQYRFSAKIDFEGFVPTQRVEETGTINLSQPR